MSTINNIRPLSVSYKQFSDNWDKIFNKSKPIELDPMNPSDWQDILSTYDCFDLNNDINSI